MASHKPVRSGWRRNETKNLLVAFALIPLLAAGKTISVAAGSGPGANVIHVTVVSLRNDNGQARCALFSSAEGFPGDADKATARTSVAIKGGTASCDFADAAPGTYAISVFHDENSNGKLDTNFIGMPKEGVGASNDAKGMFGPPKFDAAKFNFPGGRLDLTVHIAYLTAPF
jgi:uncharacterized protein (DUF2141 family)